MWVNVARAANVLELYPIAQLNSLYSDNLQSTTTGTGGDFIFAGLLGGFVSLEQPERYLTGERETFGEKFLQHQSLDTYGNGHFFRLSDYERLGPDTEFSAEDNLLYNGFGGAVLTGGNQPPAFNLEFAYATLSRTGGVINRFEGGLNHRFSSLWSGSAVLHQYSLAQGGYDQGIDLNSGYNETSTLTLGGEFSFREFISSGSNFGGSSLGGSGSGGGTNRAAGGSTSQTYFPQATANWHPEGNLTVRGTFGPIFSVAHGGTRTDPGFTTSIQYTGAKWMADVGGNQTPGLSVTGAGVSIVRGAGGTVGYRLTRYTSLDAGTGYFEFSGGGSNSLLITYGGGVTNRVTRDLSVYVRYLALRRNNQGSQESTSNIFVIGASLTFEAFRWGWQ